MMTKVIFTSLIFIGLLAATGFVRAGVYLTPATGGEAISLVDVGGDWTELSAIIFQEGMSGDIGVGDLILMLPEGFEFNLSDLPGISVSGGTELLAHLGAVSANEMKINITQISAATPHALKIGETSPLLVRPTGASPVGGDLYLASSNVQGIAPGPAGTSLGTLQSIAVEPAEETPPAESEPGEGQETIKALKEQIAVLQKQIIEVLGKLILMLQAKFSQY